ncbi:MAG: TonB-dependent receptor [Rhizomicrobium sp.]
METVVVTATRRPEAIQTVPMSITAFTDATLRKLGADNLKDFADKVPGLEFASFAPGLNRVTIRGISTQTGESSVSFYLDEMPITADPTAQPDVKVFDVDHVEVLRGPQGTLFGESSLGGTIRIITHQPDASAFSGAIQGMTSNTSHGGENYSADGMVNIPIVQDELALRVVGSWRNDAGFIDNQVLHKNDVNDSRSTNYRGILAWTPTQALTVSLAYQGENQRNNGSFISDGDLQQFRYVPESRVDNFQRYNLTVKYDADWASIVSSTSYFGRQTESKTDDTGAGFGILPPGVTAVAPDKIDYNIFTQEVRVVSNQSGPLEWIVGAFYKNSTRSDLNSIDTTPDLGPLLDGDFNYRFRQWAVYGALTWHITDLLEASAGLRYFNEDDRFHTDVSGAFAGPGLVNTSVENTSGLAPRVSLKYNLADSTMAYATVSKGFRPGGANPSKPIFDLLGVPLPLTFKPDTIWNYEVGVKADLFDNRLTLDLAAYYMDWQNIQLPASAAVFNGTYNAGGATSKGVELEGLARLTERLTLNFSGNYTDATLSDTVILNTPSGPVTEALKGNQLPLVPQWKVSLGAEYRWPISDDWSAALRGDASFVASRYNFADDNPAQRLRAYQLLNLQLEADGPGYAVTLFADNLTDKVVEYAFEADPSLPNTRLFNVGQPRTIGIRLRKDF